MPSYIERPDGVVVKYNDDTTQLVIPPNPNIPAYQEYLTWKDGTYQSEIQLREDIANGIAANIGQEAVLDAIIAGMPAIKDYQQSADPITALNEHLVGIKQLATWIETLTNNQKLLLEEINYLANLQLGRFED